MIWSFTSTGFVDSSIITTEYNSDMRKSIFRKQIFLPQDHGSWVFIFSPVFIGLFAGKNVSNASLYLVIVTLAAFLIRQPLTIAVKVWSGRRAKDDLRAAYFWVAVYSCIILVTTLGLIVEGFTYILYIAVPSIPVFAWHLWLVSKREERRQVNVEIVATGVLSLAAPAAYWVGIGHYDPSGWWLWILVWLQTAASIVYAYLRLEQREQDKGQERSGLSKMGLRAALYTSFNLASVLTLSLLTVFPSLLFIPYLVQWAETMWGITHPAVGWKPTQIGIRQFVVSTLWTVLFILTWR